MFLSVDVLDSRSFCQLMFLPVNVYPVDVLGQKVDDLVINVLELGHLGRPEILCLFNCLLKEY